MTKTLWYSITASDAVELLYDGQHIHRETESRAPELGYLYDAAIHGSFLKFLFEGSSTDGHQGKLPLKDIIFITNEEKLEIIEPGKQSYTVILKR